jgi:hypothetical protein
MHIVLACKRQPSFSSSKGKRSQRHPEKGGKPSNTPKLKILPNYLTFDLAKSLAILAAQNVEKEK